MDPSKRHVLLVDDDPTILRILSKSLQAAGYEVAVANDGDQALEMIQINCPHFLITDWEMPRMSGLELCRRMRQENLPRYVYVLFLTGKCGSDDLITGLDAGADDFLSKPVGRGELIARLRAGERVLELESRLSDMARTDQLTGIPTRRAFYEQFDRELSRAVRYRVPLSCVMIDVDYFKKVNDSHGHPAGDAVLKAVAECVQNSCRASDYVGRYGGEEFCVLLTETTEQAAVVWAERMRLAISRLEIAVGDKRLHVTASMGVAQLLEDQRSANQVIDLADQALLVAKQAGRNRVIRFRALDDERHLKLGAQHGSGDPFSTLLARNVMSTLVACLQQDETLGKAAEFFLRFRINSSPVVDDSGRLVGILSEKDVIGVMMQQDSWNKPISESMKTNVVCYEEDTPVKSIYDFLCRVTIRRVIVVQDGFPTGMISRGTLLRWYNNWLTVNGVLPKAESRAELDDERRRRHQALADTAQSLCVSASTLQRRLTNEEEDFLPVLIDTASRMQENLNDLLVDSRYFLDLPLANEEFAALADK